MKRLPFVAPALLVLCGIAAAGGDAKQEKIKRETKLLEGTWKIVAAEIAGMNIGGQKLGIEQLVFANGRVVLKKEGKDAGNYAYTVDPGRMPKEMNWLKDKDGGPLPCIYTLEGDDLKVCMPIPNVIEKIRSQRPNSFETKGRPFLLLTGKREKQ
jgi:uncharacterized protein (TIGR03067 family)